VYVTDKCETYLNSGIHQHCPLKESLLNFQRERQKAMTMIITGETHGFFLTQGYLEEKEHNNLFQWF